MRDAWACQGGVHEQQLTTDDTAILRHCYTAGYFVQPAANWLETAYKIQFESHILTKKHQETQVLSAASAVSIVS